MSSMFEKIYDEMSLEEVICRLPSDLAVGALKRKVKTLDDIKELMRRPDAGGASKVKEIKEYVNQVIRNSNINDLFNVFTPEYHQTLFGWIDQETQKLLVSSGRDHFPIEFLFNITEPNDVDQMSYILDKVLSNKDRPKVNAVLRKIDNSHFQTLLNKVLKSPEPEIRSLVLSVMDRKNYETISDNQKLIGLKAFAKLPGSLTNSAVYALDFKLFKALKPLERIMALDRYLDCFPIYKKIRAFDPEPTEDELNMILFAGCFEFNDLVEGIKVKYDKITVLDNPKDEEED